MFLTEGRLPGSGEVLAGRLAAVKLGLAEGSVRPGTKLQFEGREWTVSGLYAAPGTVFEGELWAPLEEFKVAAKRQDLTCVVARMTSRDGVAEMGLFCKTRLDLELGSVSEVKYYAKLAEFLRPVRILGWAMAAMVVLSGLFGGLNTMVAAISGRIKELGCLEMLGFGRYAIVVSLLQEALIQVGAGALAATGLAMAVLDGRGVRFTMGAATLDVAGPVLAAGMLAALFLAVAGTLIPAVRLFRTPVVEMINS